MPATAPINAILTNNGQTESRPGDVPQLARRALFAGAALLAGAPIASAAASPNPDAELIERCHSFAETHLGIWYQVYRDRANFPDNDHYDPQDEVDWIEKTDATTLDGWRAKALVWSAWRLDEYDYPAYGDQLSVSLMRDLAGPARAAILARLEKRFGALPGRTVTADGRLLEVAA